MQPSHSTVRYIYLSIYHTRPFLVSSLQLPHPAVRYTATITLEYTFVFFSAILYRCCSFCRPVWVWVWVFLSLACARSLPLFFCFCSAISFFISCHILPTLCTVLFLPRHARTFSFRALFLSLSLSLRTHACTSRQHVDANLF